MPPLQSLNNDECYYVATTQPIMVIIPLILHYGPRHDTERVPSLSDFISIVFLIFSDWRKDFGPVWYYPDNSVGSEAAVRRILLASPPLIGLINHGRHWQTVTMYRLCAESISGRKRRLTDLRYLSYLQYFGTCLYQKEFVIHSKFVFSSRLTFVMPKGIIQWYFSLFCIRWPL